MSERTDSRENDPGELYLATGRPDDERASLSPGDDHYELFAWAFGQQDAWTPGEHEAFWRPALTLWPTSRGQRARREGLAQVAEYARNALQATPEEIATRILCVEPDTLRRNAYLEVGEDLAGRASDGAALGTAKATALEAAPYAPVIYVGGVAPKYVHAAGLPVEPHADVEAAWARANELQREWWASGELTHHGRRGDVAGFVEANRRMWLHGGESGEDFPAHVKDAVDRGKWPVTALDYV